MGLFSPFLWEIHRNPTTFPLPCHQALAPRARRDLCQSSPVHPSPGKCRRQTAGFILVPANHKLICLLMQLLPVHVFPNEEHQNANLSSGVHQPPELTAVTRLEAVLLTSASCALSLALIFLLSGHFFPTDLFFSLPLNCSPAQFSMKQM